MQRGHTGEAEQRDLFARHAERLGGEIARLQLREQYVATKAELWAAKERGDAAAEERIIPKVRQLSTQLLAEEAGLQHD
jgi:hypothetical protein